MKGLEMGFSQRWLFFVLIPLVILLHSCGQPANDCSSVLGALISGESLTERAFLAKGGKEDLLLSLSICDDDGVRFFSELNAEELLDTQILNIGILANIGTFNEQYVGHFLRLYKSMDVDRNIKGVFLASLSDITLADNVDDGTLHSATNDLVGLYYKLSDSYDIRESRDALLAAIHLSPEFKSIADIIKHALGNENISSSEKMVIVDFVVKKHPGPANVFLNDLKDRGITEFIDTLPIEPIPEP